MSTGKELRVEKIDQPGQEEWGAIGGGIGVYNSEKAGDDSSSSFCFVLKDGDGDILGGVIAAVHYGWLYIDLMWVKKEFRRLGHGSRLLELVETEGKARGAKSAYLDTFSFQAPDFYKKYGFEEFGMLEGFPEGFTRYYLRKAL